MIKIRVSIITLFMLWSWFLPCFAESFDYYSNPGSENTATMKSTGMGTQGESWQNLSVAVEKDAAGAAEFSGTGFSETDKVENMLTDRLSGDTQTEERYITLDLLSLLQYRSAGPAIVEMVHNSEDNSMREAAIETLGELQYTESGNDLVSILNNKQESASIRYTAALALGRMRYVSAGPDLLSIVRDPQDDSTVKSGAITALGDVGYKESCPALFEIARDETSTEISQRVNAIISLGKMGYENAAGYFIKLLDTAVNSPGEIKNWFLAGGAIQALSLLENAEAGPAILAIAKQQRLCDTCGNPAASQELMVREQAVAVLALMDYSSASDDLYKMVQTEKDDGMRAATISALGELQYSNAADYFFSLSDDEKAGVLSKLAAMEALAKMGETEFSLRLMNIAKDSGQSDFMRGAAAETVGKMKQMEAGPDLLEMAKDENLGLRVREGALKALGKMGYVQVGADLLYMLNDPSVDLSLRISFIGVLGDLKYENAVPGLSGIVMDQKKSWTERTAAAKALFQINQ